jgi:hypothetical protein
MLIIGDKVRVLLSHLCPHPNAHASDTVGVQQPPPLTADCSERPTDTTTELVQLFKRGTVSAPSVRGLGPTGQGSPYRDVRSGVENAHLEVQLEVSLERRQVPCAPHTLAS